MTGANNHGRLVELLTAVRRQLSSGQLEVAEATLDQVLELAPGHPYGIHYLGLLRHLQNRPGEARRFLRQADQGVRHDAVACFNFATALQEHGLHGEALEPLRHALLLRPDYDDAEVLLGRVYFELGRLDEAVAAFQSVLDRHSDHFHALINLARVLLQSAPEKAIVFAERAAMVGSLDQTAPELKNPTKALALKVLARALALSGREKEAIGAYESILRDWPQDVYAAYGQAIILPQVYASEAEIDHWREHYRRNLEAFCSSLRLDTVDQIEAAASALFTIGNFPLPQHGRNDRPEQTLYGNVLHRVAAARYPEYARPLPLLPRPGRPRIGFVSAFFYNHSIAKIQEAWATQLDPGRFEVWAIHAGKSRDATTDDIERACEHFVHHPRAGLLLLRLLHDLDLDVIVYPDLGMEAAMLLPAALRLAPVQCLGMGHPITSGLPTIDWFLSSALMEPDDSEAQYTERLEKLPNLSFCYSLERILSQRGEADWRHLRRRRIVYLCTQNLGKLLPRHDIVFARILAAVQDSELWLLARPEPARTERFRERFLSVCRSEGVEPDRVVIHGRLNQSDFLALTEAADIYLDGIAWSGGNTTFEAIAMGLPVVTWPGDLMRSRHSFAMLKMMDFTDTVAASADDYIEIAAKLGLDENWRTHVREQMRARAARIYDDEAPIRGLESFFLRVTGRELDQP
ncbi:MAG: tetratricopeptide repeat protein [Alphaproteobacteria bacterium]|nr:tetratricopeptide repeat protein [Alphaproteobacteria bacterium]